MSGRRAGIAVAALAAGLGALVLLAHAPLARRAVLAYARAVVQRDLGLTLDATRLDYNLAAFRAGLADVRLSTGRTGDEPFFEAEYLSVTLSARAVLGDLIIRDLTVTNASVLVHRRADGTSNLPSTDSGPGGDPAPLRIDRMDVSRLAVDVRDEQADLRMRVPALAVRLMRDSGFITLGQPAELRVGARMTTVAELNAQATFDGRTLHLTDGRIRADEGSVGLDGSLQLVASEPAVDLRVTGSADAARLAQWALPEGEMPQGVLSFDGLITGTFADPRAQVNLASARLTRGDVIVTDLVMRSAVSSTEIGIGLLEFGVASGRVTATASVPFSAEAERRVDASWTGVDAPSVMRLLAQDLDYLPAGLMSGGLEARGSGVDVDGWRASLRLQVDRSQNSPGRLAIPGETTLVLDNGRWQLSARHTVGGVAPLELEARGRLTSGQALTDATIDEGALLLGETSLTALISALRDVGLAEVDPELLTAGRIEGDVELAGRLADPEIAGRVVVSSAAGEGFGVTSVRAEIAGRPLQPTLEYTVEAPEAVVSGQRIRDLRASGRLTDMTGPLPGADPPGSVTDAESPRGTRARRAIVLDTVAASQVDGSGRLSGSAAYDLSTGQYAASVEGTDWELMPTGELLASGFIGLRFTGTGTLDVPQGTGEITVRDAAWDGTALGELTAMVVLDGSAAQIEARAPEYGATATARVQLDAPYQAVVDARTGNLDLARVLRDVDAPVAIGGLAAGTVRFEGALDTWRTGTALVEVASLDATAGNLAVRLVEPARIRYEDERVHVDRLEARAGETAISASGELPVFDVMPETPGVLVVLTGGIQEVALAVAATGVTQVPVAGGNGPVALLARVTGSVQAPVYTADLEVGPGSITLQDLPSLSGTVRAHAGEGWLELREAVASYQSANVTVTGRVPLSWLSGGSGAAPGNGEVHARATNVTAAVLAPFLDPGSLDQMAGSFDATLDVASATPDLAAMTGQLQVDRFDMRVADLPITQRVPTRIVARDGFARVESWDWVGQGATLAVRGQVRLEDRQTAILADGVVDLRLLAPFVREAGVAVAGRLEPRLSITGTLDAPRIDGDLTITGGEIRLADPRVLVSDLGARAVLARTSAHVTELTGTVNGGTLTGGGVIEYGADGALNGQLSTSVRGMALEFPAGLRSDVDADLTLAAGVPAAGGAQSGRLSGTVTVVRGSYREPLAVVAGILAGLRTQGVPAATESSPLLAALALDVRVLTDEDVLMDNNYGRVELGADLRLINTAAVPALSGRAELREGGQLFVGRNVYTVTVGAIDFANPVAIEPRLNVRATTRAGNEDIEVTITGLAESPSVELRSTSSPQLGQAEVASLLLTGRPLEDLDPGDAAFVGTQVLGNLSAEVLGFAGRTVGIDTIRLGGVDELTARRDPFADATEIDPTTRLTFGKNLGSGVNVTYSQSLRDADAQAWIIAYAMRRGFEARFVSDDETLRSYGLRQDVSFGAMSRPVRPGAASREVRAARVSRVDLSGDLVLPEARVRQTLRLAPGDRFDFGEWQTDRDRLERLYRAEGYFTSRITTGRSEEADGIVLTYGVTAGPQTRIVATGIDLDAALRSELETAWTDAVFDSFVTDEASRVTRASLARRGYLRPSVDVRLRDEGNTKTLEIAVEPGSRTTRTVVRIQGTDEALTRELEAHLAQRGVVERSVLDPGAVEREALAYLRVSGYLRARVTPGAPIFEEDAAVVPVRVEAGAVFTVASVAFEGRVALSEEVLREAAAVTEGMPYDPSQLDGARDRVAALYRREGFGSATAAVRPVLDTDAARVNVVFDVAEGARDILTDVVVVGNRRLDREAVVRAVALSSGEPLRTEDVLRARSRLFETGLFRRVDVATEPADSPPVDGRVVAKRLRVTVEEWPALRLRYGVVVAEEWSEDGSGGRVLGPGLSVDVSRRTLFGRAITVGLATELQRRDQNVRAFVSTPTLLGRPIWSSLFTERSHEESEAATLVTNRSSVSWEQRTTIKGGLSLSYAYTFERNRTFDTRPPDPLVPALDIAINIARLDGAAAWDTRDDPLDTARGVLISSSLELSPEVLGSDIRFVRQVAQAYYFRPWRGVVFASAARVGTVISLGGQELIPSERFYAGGPHTVRSVEEDALGPRDFFGDAAGGEAMVVLNQEARLPIYRWLRGVAFVDAGNVFPRVGDVNLGNLVGALGLGVRLSTPFALLRADYARTVWGPQAPGGRWSFGIGHVF